MRSFRDASLIEKNTHTSLHDVTSNYRTSCSPPFAKSMTHGTEVGIDAAQRQTNTQK